MVSWYPCFFLKGSRLTLLSHVPYSWGVEGAMFSDPGSSLATPVPWEIKLVDPSEAKFKDRVEVVTPSFHKNVLEACGGPA